MEEYYIPQQNNNTNQPPEAEAIYEDAISSETPEDSHETSTDPKQKSLGSAALRKTVAGSAIDTGWTRVRKPGRPKRSRTW